MNQILLRMQHHQKHGDPVKRNKYGHKWERSWWYLTWTCLGNSEAGISVSKSPAQPEDGGWLLVGDMMDTISYLLLSPGFLWLQKTTVRIIRKEVITDNTTAIVVLISTAAAQAPRASWRGRCSACVCSLRAFGGVPLRDPHRPDRVALSPI